MGSFLSNLFISPSVLPDGGYGFVQLVFLGAVYAFVLFNGSNMISEGSELLLLVPSVAGIVGSVVLPVLGAVPDGAIVLFSGLGGDPADQQSQLSVGVGALAGSTIMLLTVPWFLCVVAGRVNILPDGSGNYKRPADASGWQKLSPPGRFAGTGVTASDLIRHNGKFMILSALTYLIIQGPAFMNDCGTSAKQPNCHGERWWAFAGVLTATAFFVAYLIDQVKRSADEETKQKIDDKRKQAVANGLLSLRGIFATMGTEREGLLELSRDDARFRNLLRPFFKKYDVNGDNNIDASELQLLLSDLGERLPPDEFRGLLQEMDRNHNDMIDFDEFAAAIEKLAKRPSSMRGATREAAEQSTDRTRARVNSEEGEGEGDEEEEPEVPEDFAEMTPEQQQRRIKLRAAWMLGLGTFLVLLFSDPMVDVLDDLGRRLNVSSFYVAFVLAPLASNASELIASYNYAAKKTEKTVSISFSTLLGAATMNNSFCLLIFLALVWAKDLKWEFSAETISILLIEVLMFIVSLRRTHFVRDAAIVLSFYPLSLAVVAILEKAGLN